MEELTKQLEIDIDNLLIEAFKPKNIRDNDSFLCEVNSLNELRKMYNTWTYDTEHPFDIPLVTEKHNQLVELRKAIKALEQIEAIRTISSLFGELINK